MKNQFRLLLLFSIMIAALAFAGPALAQDPTPAVSDDEVNEVAKDLFCPVCENTPLDVCPTKACAQWRELIREKLALGWDEAQIKNYFVEQYGDQVLAVPPREGINWMVYILPPLVFIGGIILIVGIIKKSKRPASGSNLAPASSSSAPINNIMDKIEQDIRKEE